MTEGERLLSVRPALRPTKSFLKIRQFFPARYELKLKEQMSIDTII
jgi:hypothetical protein